MDELLKLMNEYTNEVMECKDKANELKSFRTIRTKFLKRCELNCLTSYSFRHRETGDLIIRENAKNIAVSDFDLSVYEKVNESVVLPVSQMVPCHYKLFYLMYMSFLG